MRKHTQFLVRATEWEAKDRDQGFLLHGMELKEAIHWLEQAPTIKDRKPTELQEQYIRASEVREAGEIHRLKDLSDEKDREKRVAVARTGVGLHPQPGTRPGAQHFACPARGGCDASG